MKNFKLYIGLLISSLILISCGTPNQVTNGKMIQKRKYNKGFFINSKLSLKKGNKLVIKDNSETKTNVTVGEKVVGKIDHEKKIRKINRTKINSKVKSQYHTDDIRMKPFARVIKSHQMSQIREEIKINDKNEIITELSLFSETQKVLLKADEAAEGDRSLLIALLLCFFVGIFGVHRMYLGYYGIGIIQLLTLGFCGIWTLVDMIRLIIGDLKPKNGSYTDDL